MLEPESFDMCKNTAVLIVVMLGCLEVNIEISDTGMETVESNDCREMLGDDEGTNGVVAVMQEGANFSYKDRQEFINPFIQSISGLYQVS